MMLVFHIRIWSWGGIDTWYEAIRVCDDRRRSAFAVIRRFSCFVVLFCIVVLSVENHRCFLWSTIVPSAFWWWIILLENWLITWRVFVSMWFAAWAFDCRIPLGLFRLLNSILGIFLGVLRWFFVFWGLIYLHGWFDVPDLTKFLIDKNGLGIAYSQLLGRPLNWVGLYDKPYEFIFLFLADFGVWVLFVQLAWSWIILGGTGCFSEYGRFHDLIVFYLISLMNIRLLEAGKLIARVS